LVTAEWGDKEGFLMFNTSEDEFEDDHAIGMMKFCAVRNGD